MQALFIGQTYIDVVFITDHMAMNTEDFRVAVKKFTSKGK